MQWPDYKLPMRSFPNIRDITVVVDEDFASERVEWNIAQSLLECQLAENYFWNTTAVHDIVEMLVIYITLLIFGN